MKTTIIKNKTTVLDEVLKSYKDISYLIHFMGLNSSFNNILDEIQVNTPVVTDDFVISNLNVVQMPSIVSVGQSPINITAMHNESIFDVSARFYGNISQVVNLMLDNPPISTVNTRLDGLSLIVKNSNSNNVFVKKYNLSNKRLTTNINFVKAPNPPSTGKSFNWSFNISFD